MYKNNEDSDSSSSQNVNLTKKRKKSTRKCKQEKGIDINSSEELSSIIQSSVIRDNSQDALKNMCGIAVQLQKHCYREKLTFSDICKASKLCIPDQKMNNSNESIELIDLDTLLEERNKHKENGKLLYCGKYLHSPDAELLNIDQNLKKYLELTMVAIFGNSSELFSTSLVDLRKNANIYPLLPIFLDNICNKNTVLLYEPVQQNKFVKVLNSLYQNSNIYFQNKHLFQILDFVISYLTSSLSISSLQSDDNYLLLDEAAAFLSEMLKKENHRTFLYDHSISRFESVLTAPNLKLSPFYGAVTALIAIGIPAVAHVLSENYSIVLKKLSKITNPTEEAHGMKVRGKFLDACKILLKYYIQKAVSISEEILGTKFSLPNTFEAIRMQNVKDIPLNLEFCIIILNYFGREVSPDAYFLIGDSNQNVTLKKFFEMLHLKISNN